MPLCLGVSFYFAIATIALTETRFLGGNLHILEWGEKPGFFTPTG
ncbi:MAG: hypothetical protein ACRCT1_00025 [Microcoleaceae cyanobacterium]